VHLQDDVNLPMAPYQLAIANLLPGDMEPPNFRTDAYTVAAEAAEFEQFLDDRFPREKFPEFRREVDNPGRSPVLWGCSAPSKLACYHVIVEIRRMWRAAASVGSLIAVMSKDRLPPLRICGFCKKLFIAGRNNQMTCDKTCGSALRWRRKRAKAKQYELQRELNLSAGKTRRRKPKKKGAVK
jgi:hypothetical protein